VPQLDRYSSSSPELSDSYGPGAAGTNLVELGSTPSSPPALVVLSIATLLPALPALTLQPLAHRLIAHGGGVSPAKHLGRSGEHSQKFLGGPLTVCRPGGMIRPGRRAVSPGTPGGRTSRSGKPAAGFAAWTAGTAHQVSNRGAAGC
jgi:hypothetical protein